jgi:hypothetical protein
VDQDDHRSDGSLCLQLGENLVQWIAQASTQGLPGTLSGVWLTADENSAIQCFLDSANEGQNARPSFPFNFLD